MVARQLAILFRVSVAPMTRSPSTKVIKGEKCLRCCRRASSYIHFFPLLHLLQALLWCFTCVGLGVSVHNTHAMNTVGPVLSEVKDQEVSLLFCGIWRRHAVPVCWNSGCLWLSLRPLHGAACEYYGFVANMRGGEGFAGQVCYSVMELIMTCREEAAPLTIDSVVNGKFGVAAVTVFK